MTNRALTFFSLPAVAAALLMAAPAAAQTECQPDDLFCAELRIGPGRAGIRIGGGEEQPPPPPVVVQPQPPVVIVEPQQPVPPPPPVMIQPQPQPPMVIVQPAPSPAAPADLRGADAAAPARAARGPLPLLLDRPSPPPRRPRR
ncbi:MAG: hypothetical protein M5U28_27585 [Sandaracinaceae bacterium]|nr:hypothetical protein [Sandaracinaceae bacterium]